LRFGATRTHVCQIGDIEMVSALENPRTANHDMDAHISKIEKKGKKEKLSYSSLVH
jgi:hypothetical protein